MRIMRVDVREYFVGHLMDDIPLDRTHDGRNPAVQAHLLDSVTLPGLGWLFTQITERLILEVARGGDLLYVRLVCSQGRHRSVGSTLLFAKLFALVYRLQTEAHMYDAPCPRGKHRTRLCREWRCWSCATGSNWLPPTERVTALAASVVSRLVQHLRGPDEVRNHNVIAALIDCID